jgi:dihydroorotate dehydrogenase electron transfer subunit
MTGSAPASLARATPVNGRARVIENRPVVPGGAILGLELDWVLPAPRAGQFVHLRVGSAPLLRRPFSVLGYSAAGTGCRIELMYAVVGEGTALLGRLTAGEELQVLGPLGNGFELGAAGPLVLVAGGRGAVPLYRLIESGDADGRPIGFLFGARSGAFLWGRERLGGVEHRLVTDDGSVGRRGTVIDLLHDELEGSADRAGTRVLACGPEVMLRRVAETAHEFGVESQVALESPMGCAIGICRGCVIPRHQLHDVPWPRDGNARYATVCKEGPVFLGEEVDWLGLERAYGGGGHTI